MKTPRLKILMLSTAMAFGMLLPNTTFAQNDDFFRTSDDFNDSRFTVEGTIANNGIGQSEAPLGSGLLTLTAVGAGYVILKKKEERK